MPESLAEISSLICIEQFGYGFGFAGYMVYLMRASEGGNKTSAYAIYTSFMALGIMLPGFFSGAIQEFLGYGKFLTPDEKLPSASSAALICTPPISDYGKLKATPQRRSRFPKRKPALRCAKIKTLFQRYQTRQIAQISTPHRFNPYSANLGIRQT